MKKSIIYLLAGCICSCSSYEEPNLSIKNEATPAIANQECYNPLMRSKSEAVALATQLTQNMKSASRSNLKSIDADKCIAVRRTTSRSASDTLMYAVPYENEEGYVLVSASRELTPILAIIDDGIYDENVLKDVNGYNFFMENLVSYSVGGPGVIKPDPPITPDPILMIYKADTIKSFHCDPPRINVQWGQGWPENMYCETKYAGCGPVAAAQILTFLENPTTLALTYSGKDKPSININWSEIRKHQKSPGFYDTGGMALTFHYSDCAADEETHKNIGRIVRQMGTLFKSEYKYDGTSTYYFDAFPALKNLLPSCTFKECTSPSQVYVSLGSGVAFLSAEAYFNDGAEYARHAFIADATAHLHMEVCVKYDYNPATGEYSWMEFPVNKTESYLHCNWGDCGNFDGYFLTSLLDPSKGVNEVKDNAPQRLVPGMGFGNYINEFHALIITK